MANTEKNNKSGSNNKEGRNNGETKPTESDVVLNVPKLKADALVLDADNVNFSISVKAQLSNLTNIEIGTTIHIDKVKLDIDALEAEAYFEIKLKKIESIFLKALESLDQHPALIKHIENNDNPK